MSSKLERVEWLGRSAKERGNGNETTEHIMRPRDPFSLRTAFRAMVIFDDIVLTR